MDRRALENWIAAYERAWRTPGTEALGVLFTEGASYRMGPYEQAHRGLEAIAALWEREREGPDEAFEMSSEVVAVDGDTGVARVEVSYGDPTPSSFGTCGSCASMRRDAASSSRSGPSRLLGRPGSAPAIRMDT